MGNLIIAEILVDINPTNSANQIFVVAIYGVEILDVVLSVYLRCTYNKFTNCLNKYILIKLPKLKSRK